MSKKSVFLIVAMSLCAPAFAAVPAPAGGSVKKEKKICKSGRTTNSRKRTCKTAVEWDLDASRGQDGRVHGNTPSPR